MIGGRGASVMTFAASRMLSYRYTCERCGKATDWYQSHISQLALCRQKSKENRFAVHLAEFNQKDMEKARSEALKRLDYIVSAFQILLSGITYEDLIPDEPFIAEQYNEVFSTGKSCPFCKSRQTWYPLFYQEASGIKRGLLLGGLLAVLSFLVGFIFKMPWLPWLLTMAAAVLVGALAGFFSVRWQKKLKRKYFKSAPKHLKPEVEWGEPMVRLMGAPTVTESEIVEAQGDDDAAQTFRVRKISMDPTQKEALRCWKMRGVRHDNIVYVRDVAENAEGGLDILEEYFEGTPLVDLIIAGIEEGDFQDYMQQLCDALEFLHTQEPAVTHNAVLPDNIYVGEQKRLKLANFDQSEVSEDVSRDIAQFGTLMHLCLARGSYRKRYREVMKKCKGQYQSVGELRIDLLKLSRPSYAKITLMIAVVFYMGRRLYRILGRYF